MQFDYAQTPTLPRPERVYIYDATREQRVHKPAVVRAPGALRHAMRKHEADVARLTLE